MPDTPTPPPALTDEQIDADVTEMIVVLARARAHPGGYEARLARGRATIAAVIARAEREERERIAAAIDAVDPVEWALAGQHAGQDAARIARTPAPIPPTSEDQCETCGRILSCVGTCSKGCAQ